jgi:hypothetical protein
MTPTVSTTINVIGSTAEGIFPWFGRVLRRLAANATAL